MLTNENYFSKENQKKYMGYSQFKSFCECEAKALAEINGTYEKEPTTSMLVGSYIDAYFSRELDQFITNNPQCFTNKGDLRAEFRNAEEIIQRIKSDPFMMSLLNGEHQKNMTGTINGVEFKIKIDSMLPDITVDQKILKDCEDVWADSMGKVSFIYANRYDIQAAIYQAVRAENEGVKKPFILAVATKEKETDLRVFKFSDEAIKNAYEEVYSKAPRFKEIKNGTIEPTACGQCNYCKRIKKLTENDIEII